MANDTDIFGSPVAGGLQPNTIQDKDIFSDASTPRQSFGGAVKQQQYQPDVIERLLRAAALTGRGAITGIAGLPLFVGEGVNELYKLAADKPNRPGVFEGFNTFLDRAGLPNPENLSERLSHDVMTGMSGAAGSLGILGQATAKTPGIIQSLTQSPTRQIIAGMTGGGSSGLAREAGGGPYAQAAAGLAGGLLPFANALRVGAPNPAGAQSAKMANDAIDSGFKIPPTEANPHSVANNLLEAASGRPSLLRGMSLSNQKIVNPLLRGDIGIPESMPTSREAINLVMSRAGDSYQAAKDVRIQIKNPVGSAFDQEIKGINSDISQAIKKWPELLGNDSVKKLQTSLSNTRSLTPKEGIELAKSLRESATVNFKSDDPKMAALARAEKGAANAVDSLVVSGLRAAGKDDIANAFEAARPIIAKAHQAESALTTRGNFDAQILGRMYQAGDPMTGGMAKVGKFGSSFKDVARTPESVGANPPFDKMSLSLAALLGGGGYYASGSPALAAIGALPLASPLFRGLLSSSAYQNAMVRPNMIGRTEAAGLGALPMLYTRKE